MWRKLLSRSLSPTFPWSWCFAHRNKKESKAVSDGVARGCKFKRVSPCEGLVLMGLLRSRLRTGMRCILGQCAVHAGKMSRRHRIWRCFWREEIKERTWLLLRGWEGLYRYEGEHSHRHWQRYLGGSRVNMAKLSLVIWGETGRVSKRGTVYQKWWPGLRDWHSPKGWIIQGPEELGVGSQVVGLVLSTQCSGKGGRYWK